MTDSLNKVEYVVVREVFFTSEDRQDREYHRAITVCLDLRDWHTKHRRVVEYLTNWLASEGEELTLVEKERVPLYLHDSPGGVLALNTTVGGRHYLRHEGRLRSTEIRAYGVDAIEPWFTGNASESDIDAWTAQAELFIGEVLDDVTYPGGAH